MRHVPFPASLDSATRRARGALLLRMPPTSRRMLSDEPASREAERGTYGMSPPALRTAVSQPAIASMLRWRSERCVRADRRIALSLRSRGPEWRSPFGPARPPRLPVQFRGLAADAGGAALPGRAGVTTGSAAPGIRAQVLAARGRLAANLIRTARGAAVGRAELARTLFEARFATVTCRAAARAQARRQVARRGAAS